MSKIEKIDIILPNRIGDCILSLPALVCLKQLLDKFDPNSKKITILSPPSLFEIIKSFNLFNTKQVNTVSKFRSWIQPSDKAFFLCNTSKNIGYSAKTTYGLYSHKKYMKYSNDLPYLVVDYMEKNFPEDLITFLRDEKRLSMASLAYFGICLDFGYSVEQIQSTFEFNQDSLSSVAEFSSWKPSFINSDYCVVCMEAAYGKKVDSNRRWPEKNFIELAEKIYSKFNLPCIFIGLQNDFPIPDKPYFIDLRKKLKIVQVGQLLKFSKGYIGNDSGPLHLAILLRKKSISINFIPAAKVYAPIFQQFCYPIWNPQSVDEVMPDLEKVLIMNS